MPLRLGIIGASEGNGHPYSWSAIFNGYSPEAMKHSGFPVIVNYLSKQRWPEDRIVGAEVTHVWTQSPELSRSIADSALISNIVASPQDMIGKVDAILLARDDCENHLRFAAPLLDAGLPVYIDKPIALSITGMQGLYHLQKYEGQIFTCSALRYAREMTLDQQSRAQLGEITHIDACVPKTWEKYGVHVVEPVLMLLGEEAVALCATAVPMPADGRLITMKFSGGELTTFRALGASKGPLSIRVHGENDWRELIFLDSFSAFKSALEDFVAGVRTRTCRSLPAFNRRVVSILEMGMKP